MSRSIYLMMDMRTGGIWRRMKKFDSSKEVGEDDNSLEEKGKEDIL